VARYDPYLKFRVLLSGRMVPVTSRNPALIVRWLDYFHSWEGTLASQFGLKGTAWDDADPDGIGAGGVKAAFKNYNITEDHPLYNKTGWPLNLPSFRRANFWATWQQSSDPLAPDGTGVEAYLYQITERNYQPYGNASYAIPPLWYSPEESSEMALLTTNINTYVEESIAKFIVGDLDPNRDADWNNFQAQLKNLGIDRYLQIIQNTYNTSAFAK
jgi:putative aldouronate transport system substrate-binding protein